MRNKRHCGDPTSLLPIEPPTTPLNPSSLPYLSPDHFLPHPPFLPKSPHFPPFFRSWPPTPRTGPGSASALRSTVVPCAPMGETPGTPSPPAAPAAARHPLPPPGSRKRRRRKSTALHGRPPWSSSRCRVRPRFPTVPKRVDFTPKISLGGAEIGVCSPCFPRSLRR